MIITKHSDLLYDTKNFNKYNNIYAVLVQKKYYDEVNKSYNDQKLYIKYDKDTDDLELYYLLDSCIYMINKMHDIVYGHFYNKQDLFLYKKFSDNNKLIEYKVNKCTLQDLLYNDNDKLVISNSYEEVLRQIKILGQNKYNDVVDNFVKPLTISFYENEHLFLSTNDKIDIIFEDNCLNFINKT